MKKICCKENMRDNKDIIPEFSSGSSTHAVSQETTKQQSSKTLKRVQGLSNWNKAAFTLIELLVVVLIIGILAAIALPQYQKAVEKARTADALAHINAIEKAIELSVLQNGGITAGNLIGKAYDYENVEGSLASDLELTNGLTCSDDLDYCYDKNWTYRSYCVTGGRRGHCSYWVYRASNPATFEGASAEIGGNFFGSGQWIRFCYYESDLGQQICNMLSSPLKIDDIQEGF